MASSSNAVTVTQANPKCLNYKQGVTNTEWTENEDSILEEGLIRYASLPKLKQYAKVQELLPRKTIRDVAFQCQSKNKMKKAIVSASTTSWPKSLVTKANQDEILCNKIGGLAGKLLEENMKGFMLISKNMEPSKVQDNIKIFAKIRDNILIVSNKLSVMPEGIRNMPSLTEKMNEELVNAILPRCNFWIEV